MPFIVEPRSVTIRRENLTEEDLLCVKTASGQIFYVYYTHEDWESGYLHTPYRLWDEALPETLINRINKILDYQFPRLTPEFEKWISLKNESNPVKRAIKALNKHAWLSHELNIGSCSLINYYLFDRESFSYAWYPGREYTDDRVVSIAPTTRTDVREALRPKPRTHA